MNRAIKFRAWDIGAERIIRNVSFPFLLGWLGPQTTANVNAIFSQTQQRLIWMQFTGLKDSRGVEIYEGDILKFNPVGSTSAAVGDVQFKRGTFIISTRHKKYHAYNGVFGEPLIVGNVYENPELLSPAG
jgi:uncharacterized phage protein (TIGR01671 family)